MNCATTNASFIHTRSNLCQYVYGIWRISLHFTHNCQLKDGPSCGSESTPNTRVVFVGFSTPIYRLRLTISGLKTRSMPYAHAALIHSHKRKYHNFVLKFTPMGSRSILPNLQVLCYLRLLRFRGFLAFRCVFGRTPILPPIFGIPIDAC